MILAAGLAVAGCRTTAERPAAPSRANAPVAKAPSREGGAQAGEDGSPAAEREKAKAGAEARAEPRRRARATPGLAGHKYEVHGTIASAGGLFSRKVKIERSGKEPPAELDVADATRITLDGRAARLDDLKEGDDVRATFNLQEDKPVALEIHAARKAR